MKQVILIIVWGLLTGEQPTVPCLWAQYRPRTADRDVRIRTLVRLANPVLSNLANEALKRRIPYQSLAPDRQRFSYLGAVGRTVYGITPWLELGADDTSEGQLRKKYIELTVKGISNAANPSLPDYLIFGEPSQLLVDATFLAERLLRAPRQLWGNLSALARKRVVTKLRRSRVIEPSGSNWLLFTPVIEAALQEFTGECDTVRLNYGVHKSRDLWYKGDAQYGDGADFHLDYYNSFVIHPMLTSVLIVMQKHRMPGAEFLKVQQKRLERYAGQLERFISPEGAYPIVGRSIVYRTGVFHALGQTILLHLLPEHIAPVQTHYAMTKVVGNQFQSAGNFDANGWLRIGFSGNQIRMSESYIDTGSTYLYLTGFLSLGLPTDDAFWPTPPAEQTSLRAWSGKGVPADHSL